MLAPDWYMKRAMRLPVGFEVLERAARHAAVHRRLGNRRRDALDQARIERSGDQVVGAECRR